MGLFFLCIWLRKVLLNGDHYQSLKQRSLLKMHDGMDSGW